MLALRLPHKCCDRETHLPGMQTCCDACAVADSFLHRSLKLVFCMMEMYDTGCQWGFGGLGGDFGI